MDSELGGGDESGGGPVPGDGHILMPTPEEQVGNVSSVKCINWQWFTSFRRGRQENVSDNPAATQSAGSGENTASNTPASSLNATGNQMVPANQPAVTKRNRATKSPSRLPREMIEQFLQLEKSSEGLTGIDSFSDLSLWVLSMIAP